MEIKLQIRVQIDFNKFIFTLLIFSIEYYTCIYPLLSIRILCYLLIEIDFNSTTITEYIYIEYIKYIIIYVCLKLDNRFVLSHNLMLDCIFRDLFKKKIHLYQ